jgi:hypothetical protein
MPTQVTATLQGHPWDLWGLSRLFDGSNQTNTLVIAEKPNGQPTYDSRDRDAINRFRLQGYDVFSPLSSSELMWNENQGPVDLRIVKLVALDLVARINGIALLLDPEYRAVKLLSISYSNAGGAGSSVLGDWTPNKATSFLGHHPSQITLASDALRLAQKDVAVKFVLDAIALPRTWASLYLIYDAIATDVGGINELRRLEWVTVDDLADFSNSANNSRSIREGARHGNKPKPERPLIPLIQAHATVNKLAIRWLDWLRSQPSP